MKGRYRCTHLEGTVNNAESLVLRFGGCSPTKEGRRDLEYGGVSDAEAGAIVIVNVCSMRSSWLSKLNYKQWVERKLVKTVERRTWNVQ